MGVLLFDGVDDDIVFSTLAQSLKDVSDGAWTCAVLCKRTNNDADYHGASYLRSGTGATEAGISLSNQDRIFADIDGEAVGDSASLAITATGPHIMVLTKAAGAAAMNGWKYEQATSTWTGPIQIDASVADQIDATQLDIGSWKQSDMWEGHIGVVGWWEGAMSDTNVKTLENNWQTSDWYNNAHGTPQALFELNVAASSVVDLIGNATGRTVNGAPTLDGAQTLASWNFDGTGSSGTAYSIDAQPGSFTVTGVAATPNRGVSFDAASGSYSITGAAAGLGRSYTLSADPGSYVVTGVLTGLPKSVVIDAVPGNYAITGFQTQLARSLMFSADPGSYAITGFETQLPVARVLAALAGSYAITGSDAGMSLARVMAADPGSYTITGFAADLVYTVPGTTAYELNAEPGSYTLTGLDAGLPRALVLSVDPASYAVTGQATGLPIARVMAADPGSYVITGDLAEFVRDLVLSADPGSYAITGAVAGLVPPASEAPQGSNRRVIHIRFGIYP